MKMLPFFLAACAAALLSAGPADARAVARGDRPVLAVAQTLKAGDFVWAPELSAEGPVLLIVNVGTQRAVLFRNGVPIAATTVSTGRRGYETPTGVFTILQKQREHYSSLYDNAPMPNMQRLTWGGVALHAGNLPGYPASHGCIRLPTQFSALLYEVTSIGMTVVITDIPDLPHASAPPEVAADLPSLAAAPFEWHPERARWGIVSVIVSSADQRAVVLRDGVQIGSAPVRIQGSVGGGMVYVMRASDQAGRHWLRLKLAGAGEGMEIREGEGQRFDTPVEFRALVSDLLKPGSVVVVIAESLSSGSAGAPLTVIENDDN